MTHSITAHLLLANRLVTRYLKSGTAAKARSRAKRVRTLPGSLDSLDDQAIAHSSSIRSSSDFAMTPSFDFPRLPRDSDAHRVPPVCFTRECRRAVAAFASASGLVGGLAA